MEQKVTNIDKALEMSEDEIYDLVGKFIKLLPVGLTFTEDDVFAFLDIIKRIKLRNFIDGKIQEIKDKRE